MTASQYNKFVQMITWQTFLQKSLSTATFEKLVHNIKMRRLKGLKWCYHEGEQILFL